MIIKPSRALGDNYAEISKMAHEKAEPIYITLDGEGDTVLMSIEAFEKRDMTIEERIKENMHMRDLSSHTATQPRAFEIDKADVSEFTLGHELKDMYENAPKDDQVTMIHLFAIKNAELLQNKRLSKREILRNAGMKESYQTEISKGVRLARYVTIKDEYR